MITHISEFVAADNKNKELYHFLKSLLPYITSSEGCISCEVLRNQTTQCNFTVIEKWQSVELHKKSVENFPKDQMQTAMSLFGAAPKGDYFYS